MLKGEIFAFEADKMVFWEVWGLSEATIEIISRESKWIFLKSLVSFGVFGEKFLAICRMLFCLCGEMVKNNTKLWVSVEIEGLLCYNCMEIEAKTRVVFAQKWDEVWDFRYLIHPKILYANVYYLMVQFIGISFVLHVPVKKICIDPWSFRKTRMESSAICYNSYSNYLNYIIVRDNERSCE